MKQFFKILAYIVLSIFALSYILFLAIPPFINADSYKSDIQKLVKDNSKLNLDYSKLRFYSTPFLSVGFILKDAKLTFEDGSLLASSPKIKGGISVLHLLAFQVKGAKCSIDKPFINLEIENSKQYKVVKLIEDIINENNAKPKAEPTPEDIQTAQMVEKIKVFIPNIKISDYKIAVSDPKTSHSLTLLGDRMDVGYSSIKNGFKIKTITHLLSDDKENVVADIDIISSIPTSTEADEEVDPEEKIQIPFINLIEIYQKYDLNASIATKLRIKDIGLHGYILKGFFDIDNMNLKLSDIRLPDSFIHTKFNGKKIQFESDINALNDEKISLKGLISHGKHPKLFMDIESNEIHFANLLNLSRALLDSLNIKNNLAQIKAQGYLIADTKIKTDFKKLVSSGSLTVKDGLFINPSTNIGIKDIALKILLDGNVLNIENANAVINGSKLSANGSIDNKSNVAIKVDVDNLTLPALYNSFAPKELKNEYNLNSANLTAHIALDGKIEAPEAKVKALLSNLSLSDRKKTMLVKNNTMNTILSANSNDINAEIKNSGFSFVMPELKTNLKVDTVDLALNSESINIKPFNLTYNNSSFINVKGSISNWQKDPAIDIFLKGSAKTSDILTTLGREIAYYVPAKGTIPIKAKITGDSKKQDILLQAQADSANYISPLVINELSNAVSLLSVNTSVKGTKIKIKDSGLYKKQGSSFSDNLESNLANTKQLIDFTTVIDNNHINLLRIALLNELRGKVAIFNKSSFNAKGKITLNGNLNDINYGGDIKIYNLSIPEILLKLKEGNIGFSSKTLNVDLKDTDLNGSKLDISLKTDLVPSSILKLYDFNIKSDDINADKVMVVSDKLMKYMPPAQGTGSGASADIPIAAQGSIDIKKLVSGEIVMNNIKSALVIRKNILYLNNLSAKAFKGDISGNITMNLITGLIGAKLKGSDIDADNLLVTAAAMKDTLSGRGDFTTDISLSGATYLEQVKSLKGNVKFKFKNGTYGPFSKLENFFLAENIRENAVFKNTIGVILTPITTIDSSHYEVLEGNLDFKNGVVQLNPITSQGDILCILIRGNMNLVNNAIDSNVRVRLASVVSDLLGPLAMANPVNLVKNTPGLNIVTAQLFSVFSIVATEQEFKQIPDFSSNHKDANATKFQILLKGDVAKPLKLVKGFKWMALQKDMDAAKDFSDKYVKEAQEAAKQALINQLQSQYEANNKLKVGVEKVLKMDTTAPKVKELILDEVMKKNSTMTETEKQTLKEEAKKEVVDLAKKKAADLLKKKLQENLNQAPKPAIDQAPSAPSETAK